MKVGIVGVGFVGSAVKATMENSYQVETFDIEPSLSTTNSVEDLAKECDVLFVCVPTPASEDGSVDTSIVESVLAAIGKTECAVGLTSTLPQANPLSSLVALWHKQVQSKFRRTEDSG